jgi:hypothetical protein
MHAARRRLFGSVAAASALLFAAALGTFAPPSQADAPKAAPAVERTRREVRLLDDIYKTAIVLITQHYVTGKESTPAGEAFKALFHSMKEKKWHEVRLIDGSGDPINSDNKPADEFEKTTMAALVAGKPAPDAVIVRDGKRYLRTLTPIPVVMDKCIVCHENYRGNKGVIGALGYTLPVLE